MKNKPDEAGDGNANRAFRQENYDRYANGTDRNQLSLLSNIGDLSVFWASIVLIVFPFNGFLARDLIIPFSGCKSFTADEFLCRIRRFAWIWFGTVVLIFSISQTRFLNYIQSIVPAVIIIATLHIVGRFLPASTTDEADAMRLQRGMRLEKIMLAVSAFLWVLVIIWAAWSGHSILRKWAMPYPQPLGILARVLVLVAGGFLAVAIATWIKRQHEHSFKMLMTAWSTFLAVALIFVVPMYIHSTFGALINVGTYLRELPPGESVMAYVKKTPEDLVYYAERKIVLTEPDRDDTDGKVAEAFQNCKSVIVVTDDRSMASLAKYGQIQPLKKFYYFSVVRLIKQAPAISTHEPERAQ